MKKTFSSIVCLLLVFNYLVYAQETSQTLNLKNEVSVSTSNLNLDNLSLKYSRNISENLWFKIGLINFSGGIQSNMPSVGSYKTTDTRFNCGLMIGIERQKSITNRLAFIYGLNAQITSNYSNHTTEDPSVSLNQRDNKDYRYTPGIGIGMGVFYKLNENFILGTEVNPSINYFFENNKSTIYNSIPYKNSGFNYSMGNSGALITLKFRY